MEVSPSQEHREHITDPGKEARKRAGLPIVPVFDGYRAFAIIGVVILHLLKQSGVVGDLDPGLAARLTWSTVGHAIEVLFIVSGFVVFLPTAARGGRMGSVRAYAVRRAARLYPAYWLILTVILVLIATTTVSGLPFPGFGDVLANYTGLHIPLSMPFDGISTGFAANPATWTLSVEICFYIVLPLIAGLYFRHPWIGLGIAALITTVWNEAFQHLASISADLGLGLSGGELLRVGLNSTIQFPSWAFSFALGMTGAWVFVNRSRIVDRFGPGFITALKAAGAVALCIFAWQAGLHSDDGPFDLIAQQTRFTPWLSIGFSASLALVMISLALQPGRFGRLFSNEPVRRLGDISYGIFLSHLVIIVFLGGALSMPTDGSASAFLLWCLLVIPLSVLYGYLSARFLEQPIRRWARKYGRTVPG